MDTPQTERQRSQNLMTTMEGTVHLKLPEKNAPLAPTLREPKPALYVALG
ncbi:hypothetical protein P8S55_06070 [Halomonas sp. M1]|nr:hypothetical protein [Halomonas sp. M1]WFE72652.1 hypothetical protein P8S55_06070 [Halomonas sp. M1]